MNTVFITIRGGAVSDHFRELVEGWGSQCISMSSGQEHDKVTAAVQNATHSALISFGLCLQKIGYDAEMAASVATPPHRALIGIIQRMANINEPDTYWDIQTDNPNSEETWEKLEEAVAEVHSAVKSRDRCPTFPSNPPCRPSIPTCVLLHRNMRCQLPLEGRSRLMPPEVHLRLIPPFNCRDQRAR